MLVSEFQFDILENNTSTNFHRLLLKGFYRDREWFLVNLLFYQFLSSTKTRIMVVVLHIPSNGISVCVVRVLCSFSFLILTGASLSLMEQDRFFPHTVIRYTLIIFIGVAKRSMAVNSGTLAKC